MIPQQGDTIYVHYEDYVDWLQTYYQGIDNGSRLNCEGGIWAHEEHAGLLYIEEKSYASFKDHTRVNAYEIKDIKKFMQAALQYGIRHIH